VSASVLIVDDSLTVRMDLAEMFQTAGLHAVACATAAEARQALARQPMDLVVLDVHLPDGDGLGFIKEMKGQPNTARIPVMLLSAEAEVQNRVRGMGAGADEYVGKPYDPLQVIARARALITVGAARAPAVHRLRILVIDDSATFRNELREALEAQKYQVFEADTGEDGLAMAASVHPDAVVVDGMLPGIDGLTVVRRLKSDASLRGAPCLLLTAAEGREEELRSLEAGADAHVRKSEDLGVILVRVAALLRGVSASASEDRPSLLSPKRLLAVDDSVTYLHELADQLRGEGYDVVLAQSGEEALELLRVQPVDCILLDMVMPGLSGQETCRRIKQSPEWRHLPLVMMTAHDDRSVMIDGINSGADDYIPKSADFDVLKARLRAQLRRKHVEDETRRAREQMVRRETEARFQRLIHSNIIGVILGEVDGRLSDANDAFLQMIGYTRTELEQGDLYWDHLTAPEWRSRDLNAIEQLRRSGSATPYEKECLRKDGRRLPVLLGLVLLEGSNTVVGFVLDQTEQKVAEERLRKYALALEDSNHELELARARAEQQSQFKSKFLASMSHELRTPLNAIIGFSELLEQELFGPLNEKQQEYIQHVSASGRHLLSLVNDILDLSKVEAGRMELSREWTPFSMVVEAVRGAVRPLADKRGVTVSVALPPALPELYIDQMRVRQVLYNLLSNAIKFTPSGGTIEVRAVMAGRYLEVACQDSGIGISAADLPKLFREFSQIEVHGGVKPEGTGLGLALTKRLVELHGGTMSVTSEPGQGSTFTFTLPVLDPDGAGSSAEPGTDEPLVLVVEDDPHAAELIARHLRFAGLGVEVARDARAAIKGARERRPAAITLDILMPGIDGWAVLGTLKNDPATRDIPTVVVSVTDERGRSAVLGASDYLVKPIVREELLHALEGAGVPVHNVADLRVLLAGNGDLELVASTLKQAGCDVRRASRLPPEALGPESDLDLVLVDLDADPDAVVEAMGRDSPDGGVPVIAIVSGKDPLGRSLRRLSRSDALTPERLVRAVRQAVDHRDGGRALWHAETGLPSPIGLHAYLRRAVQRAERELKRVALVVVEADLSAVPPGAPWPRRLRPHLRGGDFVGFAGPDLLALAAQVPGDVDAEALTRRFASVLGSTLKVRSARARVFVYPEQGRTADELMIRALAWATGAAEGS
jgi:PAS domain S-box-containing protein